MLLLGILLVSLLLSPLAFAGKFEGQGKINVVLNGKQVGCLNTLGQFTTDQTLCATFTGYRNITRLPRNQGFTSFYYLNTTAGYFGTSKAQAYPWTLICDPNIDKEKGSYWTIFNGSNDNIGLSILMFGREITTLYNSIDGKPPVSGNDSKVLVPKLGDYPPGGADYVLTWDPLPV